MNMKRILPLLLSLAMALALCACGSQSSSDGAQTSVSGSTGVEDGVLTVGMECAYAPYNWTTPTAPSPSRTSPAPMPTAMT